MMRDLMVRAADGVLYRWCFKHRVYHPWGDECIEMAMTEGES